MPLLVDPDWETLLGGVEIPSGSDIHHDVVLQCHLILSLILYLGLSFHNLIIFLFETTVAKDRCGPEQLRLHVHRIKFPKAPSIQDLPAELLHSIFESVVFPGSLLDPSFSSGANSIWSHNLRTAKGLTRVCKLWYAHSIRFLYQHIAIRRPHQIERLRSSLSNAFYFEAGSDSPGKWVQSLNIICAVYPLADSVVESEDWIGTSEGASNSNFPRILAQVISLCPHLSAFGHSTVEPQNDILMAQIMTTLPPSITTLSLSFERTSHSALSSILSHLSPQLATLTINFHQLDCEVSIPSRGLRFPNLKKLSSYGTSAIQFAAKWWSLPALTQFTCLPEEAWSDMFDLDILRIFVEKHGKNLIFFHLFLWDRKDLADYFFVFEACPNLERLVLPPAVFQDIPPHIAVPRNLKWLEFHSSVIPGREETRILRTRCPAIEGVRGIGLPSYLFELAEVLPPGLGVGEFVFDLHGHTLQYTKTLLVLEDSDHESLKSEYTDDSDYAEEFDASSDSEYESSESMEVDQDLPPS